LGNIRHATPENNTVGFLWNNVSKSAHSSFLSKLITYD